MGWHQELICTSSVLLLLLHTFVSNAKSFAGCFRVWSGAASFQSTVIKGDSLQVPGLQGWDLTPSCTTGEQLQVPRNLSPCFCLLWFTFYFFSFQSPFICLCSPKTEACSWPWEYLAVVSRVCSSYLVGFLMRTFRGKKAQNPNHPYYCVWFMVSEKLIKNNREKTAQKNIIGIESKWRSVLVSLVLSPEFGSSYLSIMEWNLFYNIPKLEQRIQSHLSVEWVWNFCGFCVCIIATFSMCFFNSLNTF